MSRYTTELRYMLDNPAWTDERLGLADYPIYDELYRPILNQKIKDYYMFWEIGSETPARFAQRLGQKMRLIMPYYNKMYVALEQSNFDPFVNVRVTTDVTELVKDILEEVNNRVQDRQDKQGGTSTNTTTTKDVVTAKDVTDNMIKYGEDTTVTNTLNTTHTDTETVNLTDTVGYNNQTVTNTNYNSYNQQNGSKSTEYDSQVKTDTDNKSVTSDTPEGLLEIGTIKSNVYANTATISEGNNTDKHSGMDTETYHNIRTNHGGFDDTAVTKTGQDDTTHSGSDTHTITDSGSTTVHTKRGGQDVTITTDDITTKTDKNQQITDVRDYVNTLNDVVEDVINRLDNKDTTSKTRREGFEGITMSEMLKQYLEVVTNIDMMIINDLADLFIGVLI